MAGRIILRADGHLTIGLGHVTRLLGLADLLNSDHEIYFAIREPEAFLEKEIMARCKGIFKLKKEDQFLSAELLQPGDVVVLDGYLFTAEDEKYYRHAGARVLTVDDLLHREFEADALLNYCGGIQAEAYRCESCRHLFLGPAYLFLRKEFYFPPNPGILRQKSALFVSVGGSDPFNAGGEILESLEKQLPEMEVHLVTGQVNPHLKALELHCHKFPQHHLHVGISAGEVVSLLDLCAFAITTPSVAAWEAAVRRCNLLIYQTAANQQNTLQFFLQSGMGIHLPQIQSAPEALNGLLKDTSAQEKIQIAQQRFATLSRDSLRSVFATLMGG